MRRDFDGDHSVTATAAAADEEEAAVAAAAADAQQHVEAEELLPPAGRHALSNSHIIFKARTDVTCYLTTEAVEDPTACAIEQLNEMLLRFLDEQEAIVLGYHLLNVQLEQHFLYPEPPPAVTLQAVADVITFEPGPGDIICGVVCKQLPQSITLKVAGALGVTITKASMPSDWEFDLLYCCWVPEGDYTRAIVPGDLVSCMIMTLPQQNTEQQEEEVLYHMEGSLLVAHTGLWGWQWPRQQRMRQLLAAVHGQADFDEDRDDSQWVAQQQVLREAGATSRQLLTLADVRQLPEEEEEEEDGEPGGDEAGSGLQQHEQLHSNKTDDAQGLHHTQQQHQQQSQQTDKEQQQQQGQSQSSSQGQLQCNGSLQGKGSKTEQVQLSEQHGGKKKAAKAADAVAHKAKSAPPSPDKKRSRLQSSDAEGVDAQHAADKKQKHTSQQQKQPKHQMGDSAGATAAVNGRQDTPVMQQQQPGSTPVSKPSSTAKQDAADRRSDKNNKKDRHKGKKDGKQQDRQEGSKHQKDKGKGKKQDNSKE